jgi:sensor histidine kinase YesM
MSLKQSIRNWFARKEAQNLAKLTPAERTDLLAFDAAIKRRPWRNSAIFLGLWMVLGVCGKLAIAKMSWLGAFLVTGLLLVGFTFALAGAWFGPSRFKLGFRSMGATLLLMVLGAIAGGLVARVSMADSMASLLSDFARVAPQLLIAGLVAGMVYAVLMVSVVQYRRMQLQRSNEALQRQAQQERMGRQLADARLKLMQAQVEPHFLFNTLATVQQLAEGKAPEAARMTAQLITFLRGGLASLREDGSTLGREFKSIEAYLGIMQTRMGERLKFSVQLPDEIHDVPVPPAMLISLVENAIKHGLEPRPDGGHLDVSAGCESGRVHIKVADTGLGPNTLNSGGGVGLDNIRQRLRVLYSDRARLTVAPNAPHGFIATIDLPMNDGKQQNLQRSDP